MAFVRPKSTAKSNPAAAARAGGQTTFSEQYSRYFRHTPAGKRKRLSLSDGTEMGETLDMAEVQQRLEEIGEEVSDHSAEIALIRHYKHDVSTQIELLVAIVIKQSKQIAHLKAQLLDTIRRSMRDNIILHNVPENDNNLHKTIEESLIALGIPIESISTDRAHRKGPPRRPGAKPRPIIAKMLKSRDAEHILNATRPKKGARLDRAAIHVTPQIPEELREQRKKMNSQADVYRKADCNADVKVRDDHIIVNKNKIKCTVTPPPTQAVLQMDENNKIATSNTKIISSHEICESGSKFTLFTAKVSKPEQARLAYLKVNSIPHVAAATHLISAYRFENGNHSWEDDGDFGLGRYLYKLLDESDVKNRIVFLSRDFGGTHMGQRRFDIVKELFREVMINVSKELGKTRRTPDSNGIAASAATTPNIAPIVSSDGALSATSTETSDAEEDTTLISMDTGIEENVEA